MNNQEVQMLIFFIAAWAVIGAVITPIVFTKKGRNPVVGFFLGGISGALGGIIILGPLWFFLPRASKTCPQCAEKVLQAAKLLKLSKKLKFM